MMDIKYDANGLVPAIIQDNQTKQVLMLGYMNQAAYQTTIETGLVTFFSRSKQRLWTKGEASGHTLTLVDIKSDCDHDTLLVRVQPQGPTCHTGTGNCWGEPNVPDYGFFSVLENVIAGRIADKDTESSYVARLFSKGINKVAQKVGEEAVETVIEAIDTDNDAAFLYESADLMFHYLMLLQAKGYTLKAIESELKNRHHKK